MLRPITMRFPVPLTTLRFARSTEARRVLRAAPATPTRYEASPSDPCGAGSTQVDFSMSTRPRDTTPEAWSTYQSVLDDLDGPARLYAAIELSEAVREIRIAGLRARHPELSAEELVSQVVFEEYGVSVTPVR